jgi:hypothetical protein
MGMESTTSPPAEMGNEAQQTPSAGLPGTMASSAPPSRRSRWRRWLSLIAGLLLLWLVTAYVLMPVAWKRYTRRHPSLADIPGITHTGLGIPGDPLNVALVGTEAEVAKIMLDAHWYPADPLTVRSCLAIAKASVFKRQYDEAPVSNLYLWGRKQDLAFQQPVGSNPRKRHHVRFWKSSKLDEAGQPVWVGSASYDERVGFSHRTGQITHHIGGDVDAERDYLFRSLRSTGELSETYIVNDFHKTRSGRNGGGDRWFTDGNLWGGVIALKESH